MLLSASYEGSSGRARPPAAAAAAAPLSDPPVRVTASSKLSSVRYREKCAVFACILSLSGNVPRPVKLSSNVAGGHHYCWIIDWVSRVKQRWLQNGKVNYQLLMVVIEHSRTIYKLNF